MVSLTLATDTPVQVNGLDCQGPVVLVGETFSVLGETITEGSWLVGMDGAVLALQQVGGVTWWQSDVVWPLALLAGVLAALRGFRIW